MMKRIAILGLTLMSSLSLVACSEDVTAPSATNIKDQSATAVAIDLDTAAEGMFAEMGVDSSRPAPAPSDQTIAEIADEAGFTQLLAAVNYIVEMNPDSPTVAGLLDTSQFTVFAPTDEAFVNLVESVTPLLDPDILEQDGAFAAIDDLLGAGTIEAVVSYHVTEGRRAANSVVPRRGERVVVTQLEGATFRVSPAAMITAVGNTATIDSANISASNGIIHVIDAVILPVDLDL